MCCTIAAAGCCSLALPTFLTPTCHHNVTHNTTQRQTRPQNPSPIIALTSIPKKHPISCFSTDGTILQTLKNTACNQRHCPKPTDTPGTLQSLMPTAHTHSFRLPRGPFTSNPSGFAQHISSNHRPTSIHVHPPTYNLSPQQPTDDPRVKAPHYLRVLLLPRTQCRRS